MYDCMEMSNCVSVDSSSCETTPAVVYIYFFSFTLITGKTIQMLERLPFSLLYFRFAGR